MHLVNQEKIVVKPIAILPLDPLTTRVVLPSVDAMKHYLNQLDRTQFKVLSITEDAIHYLPDHPSCTVLDLKRV